MEDIMYLRNQNVVKRCIYKTEFLINIKEKYENDICTFYELNEIGAFVWDRLVKTTTTDEIVKNLIRSLDASVDYSIVYSDVLEFISILLSLGFIMEIK